MKVRKWNTRSDPRDTKGEGRGPSIIYVLAGGIERVILIRFCYPLNGLSFSLLASSFWALPLLPLFILALSRFLGLIYSLFNVNA